MSIHGDKDRIKSLDKSFQILRLIRANDGMKLNELVDELSFSRSTIHNHLMALLHEGLVVRENNTYHIGLAFLHFGEYARHRKPEYRLAREYVENLADETSEEVDFTVPEQGRMISLYHVVGDVKSSSLQVGSRFHMHNTAAGKSVLAELPPNEVEEILDHWGLPAATNKTITSRSELRDELEIVREKGYAVTDQELLDGYRSVGMTVHYPHGRLFGALSVGGPTYRMDIEPDSNLIETLQATINSIENELIEGWRDEDNWWQEFRDAESQ